MRGIEKTFGLLFSYGGLDTVFPIHCQDADEI